MTGPYLTRSPSKEFVQIKDPLAKGDIIYNVPLCKIIETAGLKGKGHRSCLCRLYLEGRCGQGKKCKSFHVDVNYVAELREKHEIEIEQNFITEVVVFEHDRSYNAVFAVRFPAVMKTKGLEDYRKEYSECKITPKKLCDAGTCLSGERCKFIHVKDAELKSLNLRRLRTPCCQLHGDRHNLSIGASVQIQGTELLFIPCHLLAWNDAIRKVSRGRLLTKRDICIPHINGRCKYGKSCGHLHVCRSWWKSQCDHRNSIDYHPVTPSMNGFRSDDDFGIITTEESFGLPVWDENAPPRLDRMCSTDFCSVQPTPLRN